MERCSICRHRDREAIEDALVRGVAYGNVAEKYGPSAAALSRHWQQHMGKRPAVVEMPAVVPLGESREPLLALARELREAARQIRLREETRRPEVAVKAMAQERQNLALEMRMRERQGEATWLVDPTSAKFLGLVMKKLERHPGTLEEFTEELKKMEGEDAA